MNVKLPVLLDPTTDPEIFLLCDDKIVKTRRSLTNASFVSPNTFSFANRRTSLSKFLLICVRIVFMF